MMRKYLVLTAFTMLFVLFLSPNAATGAVLNVPDDIGSIQEAIDQASEGDIVLVPESFF